jgi:hypothetical protein
MHERPPTGNRARKVFFDVFQLEREVFHRSPLYPFNRRDTRPPVLNRREAVESRCRSPSHPLQFRASANSVHRRKAHK